MRTGPALALLTLLAACSGGGGTPTPTPTPTPAPGNTAPTFTSDATHSVIENGTAAYQATATDAQGSPITFSISGGADATRFTITPAGALSFVSPTNFEAPTDADGNNVYLVQLAASDGSLSSTLDLQITVTNSREGIAVRRVGTGFTQPTVVAAIPGSGDVFVAEKTGSIWRLNPSTGAKTRVHRFVNLTTDGERGLLGLTVADDFATSNQAFAVATAANGAVEVRWFTIGQEDLPGLPGYYSVLAVPHADANNHNGGWISYGPDGKVYVAIGDGGGVGDPENDAQNPNSQLGKILRFDRNPDPFAGASPQYFRPAPGNPFLSGGGNPYVWALGLRNPFRNSFAPDGKLVIADVGQDKLEELDLARTDQPGLNFGWPYLEGTLPYRGTAPGGLTGPVSQYDHGTGPKQGNSIIGGYVYRGPVTSLQGLYVFADYVAGNIWTVPYASLAQGSLFAAGQYERRNQDFVPDTGTLDQIVSFGEDSAGNLYIVDLDGDVFEVVPEPGVPL
jgi:hypothetical protein